MVRPGHRGADNCLERGDLLADKVTDVDGSDAICMATWVPSDSEQ
jgi:hypothetical protein